MRLFAYYFDIGVGPSFFRLSDDPSVPHLLANPDVYHATPLYAGESEEVRRARESEAAALQEEALRVLLMAATSGCPYDLAEDSVSLEMAIDERIAPQGSDDSILLYLRDRVNWAVMGDDGFNMDDYADTLTRLEELRHPIPFDGVDE